MEVTLELNPIKAYQNWAQARKTAKKKAAFVKRRDELLARAKMNIYSWNTGVVRDTTNNEDRIKIGSAIERDWEDCIGISFYVGDHSWKYFHFSPARARLIAEHLLLRADYIEENEGAFDIDKEVEPK